MIVKPVRVAYKLLYCEAANGSFGLARPRRATGRTAPRPSATRGPGVYYYYYYYYLYYYYYHCYYYYHYYLLVSFSFSRSIMSMTSSIIGIRLRGRSSSLWAETPVREPLQKTSLRRNLRRKLSVWESAVLVPIRLSQSAWIR